MDQAIQNIIGEQWIRNGDGLLTVSYEDKKGAWKRYHEKFLNTEFACDRNSFSQADINVLCLIGKGMVR